jgi:site-specific DNA-methyltransferase (adenine-specific)
MLYPTDYIDQIIQGDCLEIMKGIPDKAVDMILCDLPYGITACDWDVKIPFEPLWEAYKRIIKDNGAIVLTASQPFTSELVMSNRKMFKYEWIWDKGRGSNFMSLKYMPMKEHENILIFANGKTIYNPEKISRSEKSLIRDPSGTDRWVKQSKRTIRHYGQNNKTDHVRQIDSSGLRFPKSIIKFEAQSELDGARYSTVLDAEKHPTQKPVSLFMYLIKTYTNEGDLVLDNCIGSGTTAVAAKATGRRFIGIEQSAQYCAIANKRLRQEVLFKPAPLAMVSA